MIIDLIYIQIIIIIINIANNIFFRMPPVDVYDSMVISIVSDY